MSNFRLIRVAIACLALAGTATFAATEPEDLSQSGGWSAKDANAWTMAQVNWSHARSMYGAESPEATQAQVELNTLARRLGIKPPEVPPQIAVAAPATTPGDNEKIDPDSFLTRATPTPSAVPDVAAREPESLDRPAAVEVTAEPEAAPSKTAPIEAH
jgi:hypothetical protein